MGSSTSLTRARGISLNVFGKEYLRKIREDNNKTRDDNRHRREKKEGKRSTKEMITR